MAPASPSKSIRVRLQIWYAVVLLVVIGGFAGVLYFQVRRDRLRAIDARLESAATYLAATVRGLPPPLLDDHPPRGPRGRAPGERERFREPPDGGGPRGPGGPQRGEFGRAEFGRGDEPQPPRGDQRPPGRGRFDPGRPPRNRKVDEQGPRRDGPGFDGPPPGPPPDWQPEETLREMIKLPESMLDQPGDGPREEPYFVIWRASGDVLASSIDPQAVVQSSPVPAPAGHPAGYRWRQPDRRELMLMGPHGTSILVGKPAGREWANLRWFAWQLLASGTLVLAAGLAGGWIISRSITRPIAAIARTASEISASNLSRRIDTAEIDQELLGLADVLNEMFARLEAAFERQSRFTSDASHELRTPLAVIHSHAELALSKPRSGDEYRETLATCLRAASRMATLVDGLLTLARADAGRLDAKFAPVDLGAVVGEVVELYRPQAQTAGIALATALNGPLPVEGDPALLARVSTNLLSNALRYTPEGGNVKITLKADHHSALLIVEDSGCGIPLEDQSKVFERFFRADRARSRAQGGNGLGLAICKSLVEVHHGTIGFSSVPDRGTRFEVRLPLAATSGNPGGGAPPGLPAAESQSKIEPAP